MEKLISEFSVGLFFWQTLLFLALLLLLRKFAWKPTLNAVNTREKFIEESLENAEEAKRELERIKEKNDALLAEAREERDKLLAEGKAIKDEIVSEARTKAKEEADKILAATREEIKVEKTKALSELKNSVAEISFEIAEIVLSEKLSESDKQSETVKKALSEINFN